MDIAIASLTLEVRDPAASQEFYETALGVGSRVQAQVADTPATGFRGFTISLVLGQPSAVDSLLETALGGGGKRSSLPRRDCGGMAPWCRTSTV